MCGTREKQGQRTYSFFQFSFSYSSNRLFGWPSGDANFFQLLTWFVCCLPFFTRGSCFFFCQLLEKLERLVRVERTSESSCSSTELRRNNKMTIQEKTLEWIVDLPAWWQHSFGLFIIPLCLFIFSCECLV